MFWLRHLFYLPKAILQVLNGNGFRTFLLTKRLGNLPETSASSLRRFPAGFRIIHHWRTTRYIIFRKREKKKSYIVLHKDRWRFFCRLKHILPVVRFPFPVKFLIRPLGVGLQLPAPLHQLPVWYVHQFGWLLRIFFLWIFLTHLTQA